MLKQFTAVALVAFSLATALAQTQSSTALTLEKAVQSALEANTDIKTAENALSLANRTLAARNADPTALITDLMQAKHSAELSAAQLTKISIKMAIRGRTGLAFFWVISVLASHF